MLKPILILLLTTITVLGCNKDNTSQTDSICEHPNQLPPINYFESANPFSIVDYDKNHCGYFPLSRKNYWVYLDSIYSNGQFLRTSIDTLKFIKTHQAPDGIIWWEPNLYIGVLRRMYSTDSMFYTLGTNVPGTPVVKWFFPINGDSTIEGTNYSDYSTIAKTYKIHTNITVPAGSFSDCLLYQKLLFFPSTLEMVFKPGVGILKFKQYDFTTSNLYKISTLISYHLE